MSWRSIVGLLPQVPPKISVFRDTIVDFAFLLRSKAYVLAAYGNDGRIIEA